MLTSVLTTPINHVLRGESWACKRLQSFAGKIVCIQIPPIVNFKVLIDTKGEVQSADHMVCADTTLALSPFVLPGLLSQDIAAFKLITVTGDQAFAETLIDISQHINFSLVFEHDLSNAIGDIPAHRVTHASEHILQWPAESFNRISQALAEYWTEENELLTKSFTISQFSQELADLQKSIEQLEQRLDSLVQQGF